MANPSLSPPRRIQAYTAAGTATWTVPAGVKWILVEVLGGGGGGALGGGSYNFSGGGGGAGGYTRAWIEVTPGQQFQVVVGAGGQPTVSGGGTSSFGSNLYATGGGVGLGSSNSCAGGDGGQGSGGQFNFRGTMGNDGNNTRSYVQGGAGGASIFGGGGRTGSPTGVAGRAPGSGGGGAWSPDTQGSGGPGADGAVIISY